MIVKFVVVTQVTVQFDCAGQTVPFQNLLNLEFYFSIGGTRIYDVLILGFEGITQCGCPDNEFCHRTCLTEDNRTNPLASGRNLNKGKLAKADYNYRQCDDYY